MHYATIYQILQSFNFFSLSKLQKFRTQDMLRQVACNYYMRVSQIIKCENSNGMFSSDKDV